MFEVRYTDQRTAKPTRILVTEAQLDRQMDKWRAAEADGDLPHGFCASVKIVERADWTQDAYNARTGY